MQHYFGHFARAFWGDEIGLLAVLSAWADARSDSRTDELTPRECWTWVLPKASSGLGRLEHQGILGRSLCDISEAWEYRPPDDIC